MNPMTLLTVVACILATAPALAARPDETPAGEREWGFRPADGDMVDRNPPPFVWRPQAGAASYVLQVSRREDFATADYEETDLALNAFCPSRALEPGTWHWRFAFVDNGGEHSEFSSVRRFEIPAQAAQFPRPTDEDLLARIPDHPRLFLRPEDLPRLREQAQGPLKERLEGLVAECDRLLAKPPDTTEPPKYPEGTVRLSEEWRRIWWGNRVRVVAVTNGAATLAFTHLLTGDERYAREARRLLLEWAKWDPKGATGYRYNDEAGMPAAYYPARAYTWLHAYLSEADRETVRRVLAVRGEEIYNHLHGKQHTWKPYDSHANRAWHWLGEVGIALHGEVPEADTWVSYAMTVFFTVYPAWCDADGGWHEGTSYWSSYVNRVTWWFDAMRAAFGVDGYDMPYFSHAGDFALYVMPPGIETGGFGDLAPRNRPRSVANMMTTLARHAQNPYWQWYAEGAGGGELEGGYIGFLRATLPKPEAKPPADLPSSRLFRGTGLAALHSDLVNRENDVQLELKASPLGSQSHGFEAQNSFLLTAYAKPLLIRTGQRDIHGSPHHTQWMWETKSCNSVLVDGVGQKRHAMLSRGRISDFATGPSIDYVVGQAEEAYEGRLKRFSREIIFLKPDALVIWDILEAHKPATFQWLLHAWGQFGINGNSARARNDGSAVTVTWLAPGGLALSQRTGFDPPPRNIALDQWHLTAEIAEPAQRREFVTVLQVHRADDDPLPPPSLRAVEGGFAVRLPQAAGMSVVLLRDAGGPIEFEPFKTSARVAALIYDERHRVVAQFER